MAKVLTTASKCVPNLINLSSKTSAINVRSSSPIYRSYSIQQTCNPLLTNNIHSHQQTYFSTKYQSNSIQPKNFIYHDPLFIPKRGNASQPKGFIGSLMDNIKEELNKNKDIKDNIKKFRDQAKKLEDSDALKEARDKYKTLERETMKSSTAFREKLGEIGGKVKESDVLKKASDFGQEIGKQAQKAAGKISETTEQFTGTAAYKKVSERLGTIKEEVGDATKLSRQLGYRPPAVLRKRSDTDTIKKDKVFSADTETQTVAVHKDSQWFQNWQNFKDNNTYLNKLFDLKSKYDESDNLVVRVARTFTDRVSGALSSIFSQSETSEALTEICRVDPTFDVAQFLRVVQYDIIPNIFESLARGELEILRDWCTEAVYNVLIHPINTSKALNYKYHLKIIDLGDVELVAAKIMEMGPVLVVNFQAQQIAYIADATGQIREGDPEQINRINYIFALGRDPTILDPLAAWRLVDLSASKVNHFV
ncbi:unnamed protein product [Adineta steineri]|uniref:Mitochondrial import inner membrane translocase subunit TIM44 n=5 Tax=Adineta steineri TaxID=433720 RepID=A0A818N6E2_9BILA|nr:unnamed protein product [Adineta steineri]CAF1150712.1 unnamed protein product [Adineta steineri]CAF3601210.1 unnamed protein product [Adineta steineri]